MKNVFILKSSVKKSLSILLAIFLLSTIAFTSCGKHTHEFDELVNVNNDSETCEYTYKCSCGETEIKTHTHEFVEVVNNDSITCEYTYKCECGETKTKEIKNVILIIGDGMGLEHIAAGTMYSGETFPFTSWDYVSVNTNEITRFDQATETTDSAAAATAMATGTLTRKGYVGVDLYKKELKTILDYAKEKGKTTGILTTDYASGATPAAFSAHNNSRDNIEEILVSQISSNVDLICAAKSDIYVENKEKIEEQYKYIETLAELDKADGTEKIFGQLNLEGYGDDESVVLSDATKSVLNYMQSNENGFVLMIEQAHVDKNSHVNDFEGMAKAVNSLNDTVNAVLEWAKDRDDTAILVTADHETGGLNVSSVNYLGNLYKDANGKKLYYHWDSYVHTESNVGLFYYGFYANLEKLDYFKSKQIIKNSDIFLICKELLG